MLSEDSPLVIAGFAVKDQKAFVALIEEISGKQQLFVSDLYCGSWFPFQVQYELEFQFAQDGYERQISHPSDSSQDAEPVLPTLRLVQRGIDREASGDLIFMDAFARASAVIATLRARKNPATLVVLTPALNAHWGRENEVFLALLAKARIDGLRIICVADEVELAPDPVYFSIRWMTYTGGITNQAPSATQATETIGCPPLLPGIVRRNDLYRFCPNAQQAMEFALEFRPDVFLFSPFVRRGVDFSTLTQPENWPDYAAAFCASASWSSIHLENSLQYANRVANAGFDELAIQVLERIQPLVRGLGDLMRVHLQLQAKRISARFYAAAAAAEIDLTGYPAQVKGEVLKFRGWGRVMNGLHLIASNDLEMAHRYLYPLQKDEPEFLYTQNIYALSLARIGNLDDALNLERRIYQINTRNGRVRDSQLQYVNCVNLARLYRMKKEFGTAQEFYGLAAATQEGWITDTDAIYLNVCRGKNAEDEGDIASARKYWLRAAIYLATSDFPDALAPRHVSGIIGGVCPQDIFSRVPALVTTFVQKLNKLFLSDAASPEVSRSAPSLRKVHLSRLSRLSSNLAGSAIALNAFGNFLFAKKCGELKPRQTTAEHHALVELRERVATVLLPHLDFDIETIILVPDLMKKDVPENLDALKQEALVSELTMNATSSNLNFVLGEAIGSVLERAKFELSPMVKACDSDGEQVTVRFKRFLPLRIISDESEKALLRDVAQGGNTGTFRQSTANIELRRAAARLTNLGILNVRLTETATITCVENA